MYTRPTPLADGQPTFDLTTLEAKAESFYNERGACDPRLHHFIFTVIDNSLFLKNPIAYLNEWNWKRRESSVLNYPEDIARAFFNQFFGITNIS